MKSLENFEGKGMNRQEMNSITGSGFWKKVFVWVATTAGTIIAEEAWVWVTEEGDSSAAGLGAGAGAAAVLGAQGA